MQPLSHPSSLVLDVPRVDPYRRIVDSAIDYAIVSCDDQGRVVTWSAGAKRLFGWTAREMVGQTMDRLFTPEDVAAGVVDQERAIARAEGRSLSERWHVRKDGERFWASGELMTLADRPGHAPGYVKVVRDRTLQQHEDMARRQLAANMQFLARASDELASLSDLQATLDKIAHLAVPAFADLCMVDLLEPGNVLRRVATAHVDPASEVWLDELMQRFPPDPQAKRGTWEVLRTGRASLAEDITPADVERHVADPERRAAVQALGLRSYIAAPLAAHGAPFGVLGFATTQSGRRYNQDDLTLAVDLARRAAVAIENAKLLRALRESDRTKDVFMATLAHELRNPLAPIWNGLSIIKRMPEDRARLEQVTGMIERQVAQLSRLVDDLLDVSRVSAGKLELKKEPTSLVRVIGTAVEMARPHIEAAHHKLSLSFPQEPTEVMADPARLAQVFSNLLNNAAKYTRRGGRIDVVVQAQPTQLSVRVRDNGIGIAPEMLDRVFGLFTQAEQPEERRQGGLGIGLSLVHGLVRLHGGRVEAHSEGPNKGSEFVVHLPRLVRADPPPGEPRAEKPAHAAAARRVLVVDDNMDTASTVADLLSLAGNEVETAHDGAGAVERTASFRPDVVLLDIGLPDITGYEAARRIRGLQGVRQPVLIALTGWGQQQDKQQAAQAGFDQHWTKPVDPARLMALASR